MQVVDIVSLSILTYIAFRAVWLEKEAQRLKRMIAVHNFYDCSPYLSYSQMPDYIKVFFNIFNWNFKSFVPVYYSQLYKRM